MEDQTFELITASITAFATVVIAVSAGISAYLTKQLTQENRRLRRSGTEPNVVAYLALNRLYPECLNMIIANIGNGPAYDVVILREADEKNFAKHIASFTDTPRRPPIPLLPQGERLETFLNMGHELFEDDGSAKLKPFTIKVSYKDGTEASHETAQSLDVAPFYGLVNIGKPAEREVAESLKAISGYLDQFSTGMRWLHVKTITAAEREEALEKRGEEAEKQRKGTGSENKQK